MSLRDDIDVYLTQRRARGFQLKTVEYLLRQFSAWLNAHGKTDTFTIDDAVTWARSPRGAAPSWCSQRLTAVRPFAAWLNTRTGTVPIIPPGLLPARTTRRDPFIYSQTDLDRLLAACPFVFTNVRVAAMMRTTIGLLAATGLRIGEALRLTAADLDTGNNVLTVRTTKTPLDRIVPLEPSTTTALVKYVTLPERLAVNPVPGGPIFVNYRGRAITQDAVEHYFHDLTAAIGLRAPGQPSPRLHDLRHTFATRHMIAAYRHNGTDPARTLTLLATWLGHTDPAHTYWYLSAAPELLAAAAGRLESAPVEGEPS